MASAPPASTRSAAPRRRSSTPSPMAAAPDAQAAEIRRGTGPGSRTAARGGRRPSSASPSGWLSGLSALQALGRAGGRAAPRTSPWRRTRRRTRRRSARVLASRSCRAASMASCAAPMASWWHRSRRRSSTGREVDGRVEAVHPAPEGAGVGGSRSSTYGSAVDRPATSASHSSSTVVPPGALMPTPTTATGTPVRLPSPSATGPRLVRRTQPCRVRAGHHGAEVALLRDLYLRRGTPGTT